MGGTAPESPPPESRFVRLTIPVEGTCRRYPAWRTRSPGRPVLMLHAVNGLSPELLEFSLLLADWGYRVYLPSLYGDVVGGEPAYGFDDELAPVVEMLKSRKTGLWNPISVESSGIIVDDAAAMARWISRREGDREIAVIGNSFTGGFPLALLEERRVRVAVLGQPALPVKMVSKTVLGIPQSKKRSDALTLSEEKWQGGVASLHENPRKRIVGFHYSNDPIAPVRRFDALHEKLSEAGLCRRFTAYVMTPADSCYGAGRKDWVVAGVTGEKRKAMTPHSTYLDSSNEDDRRWFRSRLREALAESW